MSSIARRRANRRNALKSTGPKTKAGKRRASLNAVSHGLSAPADPSWRDGKVSAIEGALEGEGFPDVELRRVAEAMFEFERNIAHQREIFAARQAGGDEGAVESVVMEAEAALTDDIDEMLMIDERHGGPDEDQRAWLIEAQKFMRRQQRLKHARARRDAVEEIVRSDRYMRRADELKAKNTQNTCRGYGDYLPLTVPNRLNELQKVYLITRQCLVHGA